jgi:hypothetical protein
MVNGLVGEDDTPESLKADILTLVQVVVRQADEITRLKSLMKGRSDRRGGEEASSSHLRSARSRRS